jgi:hypothetical protein
VVEHDALSPDVGGLLETRPKNVWHTVAEHDVLSLDVGGLLETRPKNVWHMVVEYDVLIVLHGLILALGQRITTDTAQHVLSTSFLMMNEVR